MLRITSQQNKPSHPRSGGLKPSSGVTIHDVARAANVTGITVSRALNGTSYVAQATRERIEKAARELGYVPNRLATALRSGQTKTIGILWSLGGPHIGAALVNRIVLRIQEHGYAAQVCDFAWSSNLKAILNDYAQRRIEGLVIEWLYPNLEEYIAHLQKFSAVVLIPAVPLETDFDQIILDRCHAICEVADHFAKTKRRRPLYLSTEIQQGMKVRSFLNRLATHGYSDINQFYVPVSHKPTDQTQGEGYIRAISSIWNDTNPYDAILCTTDEGSAAVMQWLQRKKYKIPDDVAIVGFNDNEQSRYLNPPLASVDRQDSRLIKLIDKMLFNRLADKNLPPQKEKIYMKFVCRESAGLFA